MRRASRTNGINPSYATPRQRYDQPSYRASSSQYYPNYDTLYDSGVDNYYVDDDDTDECPEREYLYGKPTYHGEYKPTRYYYARAPSYNYYNDHVESTNPLDDLHEEMLQEDHNRQRNLESSQWQSSGQPKSLTRNIVKNLVRHANTPTNDMNNAYDDEEIKNPYMNDLSKISNSEPIEYFDPLKFQTNPFNQYDSSASLNKQNYYNHQQQNKYENLKNDEYSLFNKNRHPNNHKNDFKVDKEEEELESLRSNYKNAGSKHNNKNDDSRTKYSMDEASSTLQNKPNVIYNDKYDSGFDYEEDEWINWNRKRSAQNKPLRPLKALEYELTKSLQYQSDTPKISTTTLPTATSSSSSNVVKNKANEYKGQKEVVLSRPAIPIRRHFPDNVLDALTKTANEMKSNQNENIVTQDVAQNVKQQEQPHHHIMGTKKQKRYVTSETSLVQQLNGLKQKIRA